MLALDSEESIRPFETDVPITPVKLSFDLAQASDGLRSKIVLLGMDDGNNLLIEEISFGLLFVEVEVLLQFLRKDDCQGSHLLLAADGDVLSDH